MGGKAQKEIRNFLPSSGKPTHFPTRNGGFSPTRCHILILKITQNHLPTFQPQNRSFLGFIIFPSSPGLNSPQNYRFHKLTHRNMDGKLLYSYFLTKHSKLVIIPPQICFFFSALKGPALHRGRPRPAVISELIMARNG